MVISAAIPVHELVNKCKKDFFFKKVITVASEKNNMLAMCEKSLLMHQIRLQFKTKYALINMKKIRTFAQVPGVRLVFCVLEFAHRYFASPKIHFNKSMTNHTANFLYKIYTLHYFSHKDYKCDMTTTYCEFS